MSQDPTFNEKYLIKMCQDPTFDLVDSVCGRYGRNLQLAGCYTHGRRQVKIAGNDDDDDDDDYFYGSHTHGRRLQVKVPGKE